MVRRNEPSAVGSTDSRAESFNVQDAGGTLPRDPSPAAGAPGPATPGTLPAPAVCQIISTFRPIIGGAQLATERLCRDLAALGTDTIVLTRCYPGLPRFESLARMRIHRLGLRSRGKLGAATFALHAIWMLATRLRQYRIVHVQSLDTPLFVGLAARIVLRRRLVATVHGEAKITTRARTVAGRARLQLLRRIADAHTALTPRVQRELDGQGVPARRIHAIPNGVDTSRFRPPDPVERTRARRKLELPDESAVYLCVGRLVAGKRVDHVLRAWRLLPPSVRPRHLLVLGDGRERPYLERLAAALELVNVRFEGETNDVLGHLHAADVYISASGSEGLSLALLEAMAAGLAIVATRIPATEAVLRHEDDGLLIPVDDVHALTDALRRLGDAPEWARRLGHRACARVRREFSLENVTQQYASLYRDLAPADH